MDEQTIEALASGEPDPHDPIASGLLCKYEMALLDAANLYRAYQIARLVPATHETLTSLFNATEDARAKSDRLRLEVLQALAR